MASLALVAAVVLTLAPVLSTDQAPTQTRADAAWTARLEGLAVHAEAQRQARALVASTARLEGLAVHAEAQRQARAQAAWTARLEGLAGEERG